MTTVATMAAKATDVYPPLLKHLSRAERPLFFDELPADLRGNVELLSAAWALGAIEFGRREYTETGGRDDKDSKRTTTRIIIEDGISWSGRKNTRHKPLRELLGEEQPESCVRMRKRIDPKTGNYAIDEIQASPADLRLMVRITDEGYILLAS